MLKFKQLGVISLVWLLIHRTYGCRNSASASVGDCNRVNNPLKNGEDCIPKGHHIGRGANVNEGYDLNDSTHDSTSTITTTTTTITTPPPPTTTTTSNTNTNTNTTPTTPPTYTSPEATNQSRQINTAITNPINKENDSTKIDNAIRTWPFILFGCILGVLAIGILVFFRLRLGKAIRSKGIDQRQSTLDCRYLTLLCDNLKKRKFLQKTIF
jgi:hypothetical protein